jgi:hypothetical protein
VNQRNYTLFAVNQVKGAAIGRVNPEAYIGLIGDQPIAALEAVIGRERGVDNGNFAAVNLFRSRECVIEQPELASSLTMDLIQICEDEVLVVRQFHSWNTPNKTVRTTEALQSGKRFERQLVISQGSSRPWCA